MRRYVFVILFFVVLVTPFVLRAIYGTTGATTQSPDAMQLIIVTSHVEGIRREFAEAFSAWHEQNFGKPVFVDYRQMGGTSEVVKFFEASRDSVFKEQKTYHVDLVWGGGDTLFDEQLKKGRHLAPLKLSEATMQYAFPSPVLAGVRLYDSQDLCWYGTALSSFGITFNRDVCRSIGAPEPQTWSDLADPKMTGWIVLADPTRSSSVKRAFMIVVERAMADAKERGQSEDAGWARGMGLIRQIAANSRMFTDSGSSVPGIIASGDAAAGMTIDYYGRSQADAIPGNRLAYIDPPQGTAMNSDPIGLINGAPHPELAQRFVEFVLSEQGQKLWNTRAGSPGGPRLTSLRRMPVAPGAYADLSNFTDPENPYELAGSFVSSPDRLRTWGIIDVLIEVSCIDLLDELRETRRAILENKRDDLDRRLGAFPFDQQEALKRGDLWKKSTPLERIELKRRWREEFRREYSALRALAQARR